MKFYQILILILSLKINPIFGSLLFSDKIIAIVNHNIILNSDITNKINFTNYDTLNRNTYVYQNKLLYYTILDRLIIDNLIFQTAAKENIKIELHQPNQIIKYAARIRNMTPNQFNIYLDNLGINQDKYFLEIYQDTLKTYICNQIKYQYDHISPNEIKKMAQQLTFINFFKRFKLIHISIKLPIQASSSTINQSEKFARLLIKEKKMNQNWQKLIHSYYLNNYDLFNRINIQNTGWMQWDNIPIIFDQYLKTAKPGDIIGPIYSDDSIHILEIEDIQIEKHRFPIIRVKINDFISKDKSNDIYIKQQLLKIKEQIENGQSTFNIMIQEKSKDFYSENYGNLSKWINLNQFNLSTQKTLLSLKKNQISMPIHTDNGWCLIKLIDIDKLNYSEIINERAYLHILHQKFDTTLNNWIQELKLQAYIKIIN